MHASLPKSFSSHLSFSVEYLQVRIGELKDSSAGSPHRLHEILAATRQKIVVFNLINYSKIYCNLVLIHYWKGSTILLLIAWQEVVPLIVNNKSHYYSFKTIIKYQSIFLTCLLVFSAYVCDIIIWLERVHSLYKASLFVYLCYTL